MTWRYSALSKNLMLITSVLVIFLSFSKAQRPNVETTLGPVRGTQENVLGRSVSSFLGIPFAEPPVGALRFQKPRPKSPWFDTFNADQKGHSCPQIPDTTFPGFSGPEVWNPNTALSEDCLHLNVWVPGEVRRGARKTVMVWIFGGGYVSGTSTLDLYDGRNLAVKEDVIVVSINYRIGALGFLYFGVSEAPGSMGLMDQQLALRWVQDNINEFGGDPNRVTLFGESAGGCSVMYHLVSPSSHDLFQFAIMESVGSGNVCFRDHGKALELSRGLAESLKCDASDDESRLACLLQASPDDIVNKQFDHVGDFLDFGFLPTIDNEVVVGDPWERLDRQQFKKTSILLGSNANEGSYWLIYEFSDLFPREEDVEISQSDLEEVIEEAFHKESEKVRKSILREYSNKANPDNGTYNVYLADQVTGDPFFVCPTNRIGQTYQDAGQSVYMYYMEHRSSINPWPRWMGVPHGYEIEYVFGQPLNDSYGYTQEEKALSRRVMNYLSNFAKTGNPNEGRSVSPVWPEYGATSTYLQWDTSRQQTLGKGPHARKCFFWNHYIPLLRENN